MGKARHPHNSKRPIPKSMADNLASGDIAAVISKLTPRQRAFAKEYVIDHIAKHAAIRAGYALTNAEQQGYLLLQHKGIQAYIAELKASSAAKIMTVDPDYIIAGITRILSKDDAKDSDKLRGYELLARHLGMFIERTELTGKDGGPLEVDQRRIEEEADAFTAQLRQLQKRSEDDKQLNS